jgi:hypothetical protein
MARPRSEFQNICIGVYALIFVLISRILFPDTGAMSASGTSFREEFDVRTEALLESNTHFFSNDLVSKCLLTVSFADYCKSIARQPPAHDDTGEYLVDGEPDLDGVLQFAFECSNEMRAYLQFSVEVANIIANQNVAPSFCVPIIQKVELTGSGDRLEFGLDKYLISFTITAYEVVKGLEYVHQCTDPIRECPSDTTPLGRTVLLEIRKLGD